jgi:hypothetical protein
MFVQRLQDLLRREIAVASRRLQLGIGVGVRLDDASEVGGELGVVFFESRPSASGKVLDASDAAAAFVLAEGDVGSSPSESSFRSSRTSAAETVGDFGLETSAVMAGERLGREPEEIIGSVDGVVHDPTS